MKNLNNITLQKMITDITKDKDFPNNDIPMFLFLWLYNKNKIQMTQAELSELTGLKVRTARQQLYRMRDAGYINYGGHWDNDGKRIEILKYRHADQEVEAV